MQEQIRKLLSEIQEAQSKLQSLKPEFEEYIKNTDLPLDERWRAWVAAPVELKNTDGWCSAGRLDCFQLLGIDPDDAIGYDGRVMYAERYQTVYMDDIGAVQAALEYDKWDMLEDFRDNLCDGGHILASDEELIEAFISIYKEEILSKNLHSFKYDW